jgi:hypothetical protein
METETPDPPLDDLSAVTDEECARIMRRVMGDGDGVCAFNSSI